MHQSNATAVRSRKLEEKVSVFSVADILLPPERSIHKVNFDVCQGYARGGSKILERQV